LTHQMMSMNGSSGSLPWGLVQCPTLSVSARGDR
jgi:hypothetical protein